MSFTQLLDAARDDFNSDGVPAKIHLGRDYLAREAEIDSFTGEFARIVLIPTALQYGPPLDVGGPLPARANRKQSFDVHVLARATTQADVALQHAEDLGLVELMADRFMLFMHRFAEGSFEHGNGAFNEDPVVVGFGASARFSVTVDVPVLETPWQVVSNADPTIQGALLNSVTGVETEGIGVG